jgi:hypothetical protein
MTDPTDEEALTWDGDEDRVAPRRPAPRLIDDRAAEEGGTASGGSFALLVLGVLGGIAVIETAFWIRSAFEPSIAVTVGSASGNPLEIGAFVLNLVGRVLAVSAPVVWFALIAWRVKVPSRRVALLVLGALLLVPWPAILAATS